MRFVAAVMFMVLIAAVPAGAQPAAFTAKEPALLTTAGQSADLNMAKVILERSKVAVKAAPLAGTGDLKDAGSLIVVIGGSTKGLGAAGIDPGKELARVEQLVAAAAAQNIPVIGMHIGGKARRGELSDRFVEAVAPKCGYLMVVKEGDSDGYFSKVMAERKIPGRIADKLTDLQETVKAVYGK